MTAWLLTFLLHSTIWCALAWLLLRLRPGAAPRTRELIWFGAIALSLATPTIQSAAPAGASLWSVPIGVAGEHTGEGGSGEHGLVHDAAQPASIRLGFSLMVWFWLGGGLVLLTGLGARLFTFSRAIADRDAVTDARCRRTLAALSERAGLAQPPRLTQSHVLNTPAAFGAGRSREICLPPRAAHELDDEELSAMLGHEVAHHRRADFARSLLINALLAVFFVQPMFWIARRELRYAAEAVCDDWASTQINDPAAMASCLTTVARWLKPCERELPVPCAGQRVSVLERRVRRLLDDRPLGWSVSRLHWIPIAASLLLAGPWITPAMTGPSPEARPEAHDSARGEHHGESHERAEHTRRRHRD